MGLSIQNKPHNTSWADGKSANFLAMELCCQHPGLFATAIGQRTSHVIAQGVN